jgi:hypothetical protein
MGDRDRVCGPVCSSPREATQRKKPQRRKVEVPSARLPKRDAKQIRLERRRRPDSTTPPFAAFSARTSRCSRAPDLALARPRLATRHLRQPPTTVDGAIKPPALLTDSVGVAPGFYDALGNVGELYLTFLR